MASDVWAVVPAAGIGQRFGADRPKQYLALGDRPIIAHVVAKLAALPSVAGVVVAVARSDPWWEEAAKAFDASVVRVESVRSMRVPVRRPAETFDTPLVRVEGGAERRDSVVNALDSLGTVASDADLVMVHDAVRPCVSVAEIERVVAAARRHRHGAILATPVSDTLKRAGPGGVVEVTVDRGGMWRALTPQVFPLGRLRAALGSAVADGVVVTDEAQAMERAGEPPVLVEGSPRNIKITRPEDLALARVLLEAEEATR